ncbi:hypothetical protein GCM10027022_18610 [Alpinimonas psychrophila]
MHEQAITAQDTLLDDWPRRPNQAEPAVLAKGEVSLEGQCKLRLQVSAWRLVSLS